MLFLVVVMVLTLSPLAVKDEGLIVIVAGVAVSGWGCVGVLGATATWACCCC
jgi:hypothetical protein